MKILMAEDEAISRQILQAALVGWGHEVIVACDGSEAWDVLQTEDRPLLAILDVMMPEMGGIEICRRLRKTPMSFPPYLILLTAKRRKEDIVCGLEAGANDYMAKPFDPDELRARLNVGVQMVEIQQQLADRVHQLEDALAHVKQLQGILPMCSYCKSIRDDQNYWKRVEDYISENTDSQLSHSICPACFERVVQPDLDEMRRKAKSNLLR